MSKSYKRAFHRLKEYLDMIYAKQGKATKMDFLRIAGNETNANRWIQTLIDQGFLSLDGKYFILTDHGLRVRSMLENVVIIEQIVEVFGGTRLYPRFPKLFD